MPSFEPDRLERRDRRDTVLPVLLVGVALVLLVLPVPVQQRVSALLRNTVLLPFIWTQDSVQQARVRTQEVVRLQAQYDSAAAALAAQRPLAEENAHLRELLELRERAGLGFVSASATRPGTPGSESMFLLDVGTDDGVQVNAPVVVPDGLVGVVREVGPRAALAMDWTHPDFRVSVMTADGEVYGVVEPRSGRFREDDRLLLGSIPFHTPIEPGTPVVTSGVQGAVYPRGILVGTVGASAETDPSDEGWRRSYWLEPAALPGRATHVLVLTGEDPEGPGSLGGVWLPVPTAEGEEGENPAAAPAPAETPTPATDPGADP